MKNTWIWRKRDITVFVILPAPSLPTPPSTATSGGFKSGQKPQLGQAISMNESQLFRETVSQLLHQKSLYQNLTLQLILKDGGCIWSFHAPLTCKRFETWKVIAPCCLGPPTPRGLGFLGTGSSAVKTGTVHCQLINNMSTSWKFQVLIQKQTSYWR